MGMLDRKGPKTKTHFYGRYPQHPSMCTLAGGWKHRPKPAPRYCQPCRTMQLNPPELLGIAPGLRAQQPGCDIPEQDVVCLRGQRAVGAPIRTTHPRCSEGCPWPWSSAKEGSPSLLACWQVLFSAARAQLPMEALSTFGESND